MLRPVLRSVPVEAARRGGVSHLRRAFIYETAITIGHEAGVMLVNTSVSSVGSQLL